MSIIAFNNGSMTFSEKWKNIISTIKRPFIWTDINGKKTMQLKEQLYFLNKTKMKNTLRELPYHSEVIIDASLAKHMDADVIMVLKHFVQSEAKHKKIKVETIGFDPKFNIKNTLINN